MVVGSLLNVHNPDWDTAKARVRKAIRVGQAGGRSQSPGAISCCLQDLYWQKLEAGATSANRVLGHGHHK